MELYLLRHAEAGAAPRDDDRRLTRHGHEQARAVAAGLVWLDLDLTAILSSPLPRAVQTAQPIAGALGCNLTTADALAIGHTPEEALALIANPSDRLLLIGHQPQLTAIARAVAGGRMHLRTAMLARLELEVNNPEHGELAWLLSWQHLKRLGRGG